VSLAPTLMVQGTSSSTGKSLLITALCRILHQAGVRVAPFKSQNMALNAAVTTEGLEIGRAQAVQAEAAGIEPTVDMNPILLKPEGNSRSQVVVMGKSIGAMSARDYHEHKRELGQVVATSLRRLREQYEFVLIEGAGSPAEINLRDREIVNMYVARLAEAPVLLVGDIDRGGVFASFVGTLELLEPEDRARVVAFVVNKFRGDVRLLQPGLDYLTTRTSVPVLGVVPFISELRIADEDSVALDDRRRRRRATTAEVDIAIVRLPRISNYDDFLPLEHEPGVVVRFTDDPRDLPGADLVILPGSKSTVSDLQWVRQVGISDVLEERRRGGHPILGICGGCQMLGERIDDLDAVESNESTVLGLGFLPLRTRCRREKTTARVKARLVASALFASGVPSEISDLAGYEIHAGEIERTDSSRAAFEIIQRNGQPVQVPDGAVCGQVVGTLIHGLFDNDDLRAALVDTLRARRGLVRPLRSEVPSREREYDRLAAVVRENLDWKQLSGTAALTLRGAAESLLRPRHVPK
jgi:adenosylcobyric acid synthase